MRVEPPPAKSDATTSTSLLREYLAKLRRRPPGRCHGERRQRSLLRKHFDHDQRRTKSDAPDPSVVACFNALNGTCQPCCPATPTDCSDKPVGYPAIGIPSLVDPSAVVPAAWQLVVRLLTLPTRISCAKGTHGLRGRAGSTTAESRRRPDCRGPSASHERGHGSCVTRWPCPRRIPFRVRDDREPSRPRSCSCRSPFHCCRRSCARHLPPHRPSRPLLRHPRQRRLPPRRRNSRHPLNLRQQ